MSKLKCIFVLSLIGGVVVAGVGDALRHEVDEVTQYAKKEVFGAHAFIYQEEAVNGVLKKQWFVDGDRAAVEDYERERTAAEHAWLEATRAHDEALRLARQKEHNAAARAGWVSLMKRYSGDINVWLARLADRRIAPSCWAFAQNTVASEKDLERIKSLVASAQAMVSADHEISVDEYKKMAQSLEALPERVQRFVYATLQKATENSDDPHLLKELLELLDGWAS